MAILDTTMGAILIGVVIASILYGCTCIQTWYYFTHYPADRWYIKLVVFATFCSDTGHEALIIHFIYTYVVTNFGNWEELGNIVISLVIEVFFNGFTALLVQSFLAMRIYTLSNKNVFALAIVMVFVLLEWIIILVYSIKALPLTTYQTVAAINPISMTINGAAAAGDIIITICLCYLLQKSRTGFRRSDWTINKLTMFSINTGLLTSLCALGSLICICIWPHSFVYIAFYFSIGRLYCNSLLATLNARKGLRGPRPETHTADDVSLGQVSQSKATHNFLGIQSKRTPNNLSIKIDTTQEFGQDEYNSSIGERKNAEAV